MNMTHPDKSGKETILIIDDEAAIRKLLDITLQSNDYKVIQATTAKEGEVAAAMHQPDLIILDLGLPDDAEHVNPNGGAIALGHPLGMSGARLVTTASYELARRQGRYALCTMCIGVGQGIAMIIERV